VAPRSSDPTSEVRNVSDECRAPVYWYEGEYEGWCELAAGHDGPHFDGLNWYDDDNHEVDPDDRAGV